mgnify:CR=1 FL=1
MTIENIDVRFFAYGHEEIDIVEVDEDVFESLGGTISYERHTIFNNGVSQICLTTDAYIEE